MRLIPFAEIKDLVSGRSFPEEEDVKVRIPRRSVFFALLCRVEVEVML